MPASSVTVWWVGSPDGTITHTVRGAASRPARPARVGTSLTFGSASYPTTSWPARRSRAAMLPPIRPSPIIPICMAPSLPVSPHYVSRSTGSAAQPDRHQQVAVIGLLVGGRLAGDQRGLARLGERDPGDVRVDRGEAVEQVGRVEGDLDVVSLEAGVEELHRLGLVPAPGL